MISGTAALAGTLMVQLAGWPRLLADATRICIPRFKELFPWKTQFPSPLDLARRDRINPSSLSSEDFKQLRMGIGFHGIANPCFQRGIHS